MRLTMVASTMGSGGAEKVIAALADHFVKQGHQVSLLTFDDGRTPPFYALNPQVKHQGLNLLKPSANPVSALINNFRRIRTLRRAFKESKPDVILSFLVQVNVFSVFARRGLVVPLIISERDDPWESKENYIWCRLRDWMYPFADRIVVHTEHSKAYFPKRLHHKIEAIPNPLMVPNGLEPKNDYQATQQIISIGRLDPQKGMDVLIQAFAQIRNKHTASKLVILGEGPQRPQLEQLVRLLKLEGAVTLPGVVKNVFQYLAASDIFVSASRYEGFGNVLTEAMACGLPIISTETSGPKVILQAGQDGLFVPIEDVQALVEALNRLIENAPERERLGRAARENVKRFRMEHIFEKWDKLISKEPHQH